MGHKISVIIPTARRPELLRDCLESLQRQTLSGFRTILVSDGAGPWAGELAGQYGCTLLEMPNRSGFAAAVNRGVAAADSQYVLLLNDDVRLDRDWLRITSSFLDEKPEIAFCCGKILRPDGVTIDGAGDAVSLAGSAWRLGCGRSDSPGFDLPRGVFACPATAALVRRNIFEELGGFDENFVAYLEDVDFSLRAARRGCHGYYLPRAKSCHWGGATSGGPDSPAVFRLLTQNQLMILAKDYPRQLWLRLLPRIAWVQLLWAAMAIRKRRVGAYCSGIARFLTLLPKAIRKRRPWRRGEVQAFAALLTVSEAAIYADLFAPDRREQDTFWKLYFCLFPPRRNQLVREGMEQAPGTARAKAR